VRQGRGRVKRRLPGSAGEKEHGNGDADDAGAG
jgi:hypothetical protein